MYHLRLKGDHYQMGVKRGNIFQKAHISFPLQLDNFQLEHGKQSEEILRKFFPEICEEVRGVSDAIGTDYLHFISWMLCMGCCMYNLENNIPVEVRGCTAFAYSSNGRTIYGRNNDLPPYLREGSKSEIYAPKNGNRFNITTSSFINGEEGVNEHGFAVAMTFVMTDLEKIKAGFNSCFIVRYLLEKADNTEQAVSLLMGLPVSSNCNILLADKKGNMVVVECTPILKKVRAAEIFENGSIVCTVNSFTSDEMKPYVFFGGLLFLLDFLHNRYNDNLLEEITLLIEALVEQQERTVFSEAEDTLTARLQHQLLKLRNILKAQNQMLTQEKEQIKTLISDISHQIKTPVAAANTFAQLLGDTGLSDEERREYIATLQMSLEKLTFLTNSLIKMSRLESGIIRLKPEQSSLNDIVMQAVKTVYAKARDKNITITFDCGQTFEALLDFNWTAEAVTNVLDNAVKYTPSGGVVDLKITEYPSYLRLDVSDNGIGIPEEEQAKIFGRFYRGKQSAGVDGVGIGLYLTRDIVNKQNGYIKVASDEKGTIFSLFLKKV